MSSQASSSESNLASVYQHLLRLHQAENLDAKQDSLNALPENLRQQIFYLICEEAGNPSELDYGKVHVFDSLPRLQSVVHSAAFLAFHSFNLKEKETIARKICGYAGHPYLENRNWEEMHVWDNIPVLLKTMHDSLGDLTPELQLILNEWVDQAEPGEQRVQARAEIIDFLTDRKKTELNLNHLSLKDLPPIFSRQPFISRLEILQLGLNKLSSFPIDICQLENLTQLDLAYNEITSLPKQIGQLQNLAHFNLDKNRLTSIPEQIGQLQNLKALYLGHNHLESIPGQISQLQNLKELYIDSNRLVSLPEQIGLLQNLTQLHLNNNLLTSIPEQIGQLQNLNYLYLNKNQLVSLPEQIGLLQNLTDLNLDGNQTLQGLPNQLLDLSPECLVDITSTGLSDQVRANLQQACNDPGYQGPQLTFSIEHMEHQHGEELKPLPILLAELFAVLEEEPREFPHLDQLDEAQKGSIQSWLSRLSDTADYERAGEFQKAFVKQIVGYLQEANNDPKFREAFLNIIADAAITCGDRISLSILHVGIASRLRLIKDIQQLRQFLIGTVWPVQMLEEIARKKTETLSFFDEIEVYLGYPIMLRERLGLEISVQEMLYFRCSALKQSDLDQAAEFVMQQQNDEHAVCSYLASREDWINALKAQYPERSATIDEENFQELEDADEDQDKLDQLEAHQKERWEALTAWALAAMDPQWSHNSNS